MIYFSYSKTSKQNSFFYQCRNDHGFFLAISCAKLLLTLHPLCLDINECLAFPCGPYATKKCINLHGSYKCSACDEGLLFYRNPLNEGRCVGKYDIRIMWPINASCTCFVGGYYNYYSVVDL